MADHARAAADVPFGDNAAAGVSQGGARVLCRDVLTLGVVEEAVVGLADDGQRPRVVVRTLGGDRVADDTDAERIRDADRRRQHSGLAHPLESRQLAVAVQAVTAGEERRLRREHDRHAGAHVRPLDQRRVTDAYALDVGDRIMVAGLEPADQDSDVSRTHKRK